MSVKRIAVRKCADLAREINLVAKMTGADQDHPKEWNALVKVYEWKFKLWCRKNSRLKVNEKMFGDLIGLSS